MSARQSGWRAWALALLWIPVLSHAGAGCTEARISPQQLADATVSALRVVEALDAADAPVAMVSRVGTDLSKQGLFYSHSGFVVRDHTDGRWSVVHLLNECNSEQSSLYVQGLVDFFTDDLVNQDARIDWFEPELAERLAAHLNALPANSLHHPRYNLISRPGSRSYQNSTAWVVETLGAVLPANAVLRDRERAYASARASGFVPDTIKIGYHRRVLGGLFGGANLSFTDHPVGTRVSGQYPVVTVRSILRWLDGSGLTVERLEWRGGVRQRVPGPG